MRRRSFLQVAAGLAGSSAMPTRPPAQQRPDRIFRIGVLSVSQSVGPNALPRLFAQLQAEGLVLDRNLWADFRSGYMQPEALPKLAAELIALKPDTIVAHSSQSVEALKPLTSTIPIVMMGVSNPVESGFVTSLSRPGGNITGISDFNATLAVKRLQVTREVLPGATRWLAISEWARNQSPAISRNRDWLFEQASAFGFRFVRRSVTRIAEVPRVARESAADGPIQGIWFTVDPLFADPALSEVLIELKLPTSFGGRQGVVLGGLLALTSDPDEQQLRAATIVAKVLQGAAPADLPVEQPTRSLFVINLKTAAKLGLSIPPAVLARADEVIE